MFNLFSFRTMAIIKRELKAQVMTKMFIFTTIFIPMIMFGLIGLQTYMMSYEGKKDTLVEIVAQNEAFVPLLKKAYETDDEINRNRFKVNVSSKNSDDFKNYLQSQKKSILSGQLNGLFFIPEGDKFDKKIEYYSKNPKNNSITLKIRKLINGALVEAHFSGTPVSEQDIQFARKGTELANFKVTEKDELEKDNYGAYILAGILAFLLYMSLIMIGMQMLRAVVEEKENRVVEVLLSSVHATELMTAKIIATTCAGLLQIMIWMLPFLVVSLTSILVLPEKFQFTITLFQIIYFVINYGIGLITFLGLYAAVGAIFDNMTEAQQGAMPIMFLILVPFYICFSMMNNPTNTIAEVSSMVPFASIIVMPVRMAIVDVPLWQVAFASLINLGTLAFIFSFVGKIYRVGILKTGKRPQWKEIYRWARD